MKGNPDSPLRQVIRCGIRALCTTESCIACSLSLEFGGVGHRHAAIDTVSSRAGTTRPGHSVWRPRAPCVDESAAPRASSTRRTRRGGENTNLVGPWLNLMRNSINALSRDPSFGFMNRWCDRSPLQHLFAGCEGLSDGQACVRSAVSAFNIVKTASHLGQNRRRGRC